MARSSHGPRHYCRGSETQDRSQERKEFMKLRLSVLAALLSAIQIAPLQSQSYQGGIRGKVSDPTGGAIDVAKVTLISASPGVSTATLSNTAGEFGFNPNEPATYHITAYPPGPNPSDPARASVN